jgi:hypothetical protein
MANQTVGERLWHLAWRITAGAIAQSVRERLPPPIGSTAPLPRITQTFHHAKG